jgi:hypothetical protein
MLLRIALFFVVACLALLVVGAEDYYKVCREHICICFGLHLTSKLSVLANMDDVATGPQERCLRSRDQEGLSNAEQEVPPRQEPVRLQVLESCLDL